jgi:hypothetical protein
MNRSRQATFQAAAPQVLMDEAVMESLLGRAPDHPQVNGKKFFKSSREEIRLMRWPLQGLFLLSSININLFRREGDKTFLLQTTEQFSASHVL